MIGIVIVNYNNLRETLNCIESISKTINDSEYLACIVDNKSDDRNIIENEIKKRYPKAIIILNEKNGGYASGNNIGIKEVLNNGCTEILICNPDIVFQQAAIYHLLAHVKDSPKSIVCPIVSSPESDIAYVHLFLGTNLREKYLVRTFLKRLNYHNIVNRYYGIGKEYSEVEKIYAPSGCCFMIGNEATKLITPFNENTFLYSEEFIIGDEAKKFGINVSLITRSRVLHNHAKESLTKATNYIYNLDSEIYYTLYYRKFSPVQVMPLLIYRILVYLIRSVVYVDYSKNLPFMLKVLKKRRRNEIN